MPAPSIYAARLRAAGHGQCDGLRRGTSPLMLTGLLRDAVDALAVEYEDVAPMSLDPRRTPGVRPAPARKRR
jgi:hypothetical protein